MWRKLFNLKQIRSIDIQLFTVLENVRYFIHFRGQLKTINDLYFVTEKNGGGDV